MLSRLQNSPNVNPSSCSVAHADLTLCSLPSNCRSCSFRSKTQSCAPLSLSHSYLMHTCPALARSALLLHCSELSMCKQGPQHNSCTCLRHSPMPYSTRRSLMPCSTAYIPWRLPPACQVRNADPGRAGSA